MDYWFAAHEMAKLAAEMEAKGVAFYKQLQGVVGDATISDMCAFFSEQEQKHQAKFFAISEAHRTSECEQCYSVDLSCMMKASMLDLARFLDGEPPPVRSAASVSDSLALAARLEAMTIRVYTEMEKAYAANFTVVLAEVREEERKHLQMIQQVRERLQPPAT